MIMEKYITKNGIKYELRGEQYYPMLEISEQTNYEIPKNAESPCKHWLFRHYAPFQNCCKKRFDHMFDHLRKMT